MLIHTVRETDELICYLIKLICVIPKSRHDTFITMRTTLLRGYPHSSLIKIFYSSLILPINVWVSVFYIIYGATSSVHIYVNQYLH